MHINIKSYIVGFLLSVVFTVAPFYLVMTKSLERNQLVVILAVTAVIQLVIQLKFFLHLDFSPSLRDNMLSFVFTGVILIVIVFGSMWVLHDLDYLMMVPVMKELGHAH